MSLNFNYVSGTHIRIQETFSLFAAEQIKETRRLSLVAWLCCSECIDRRMRVVIVIAAGKRARPFLKGARGVCRIQILYEMDVVSFGAAAATAVVWGPTEAHPFVPVSLLYNLPVPQTQPIDFPSIAGLCAHSLRSTQFSDHYNRTEPLLMDTF